MIEIIGLSKRFGSLVVLDNVSFVVGESKLVVVLGPSGTGKTVFLKSIIGLVPVDSGKILFDGKVVHSAANSEIYQIRKGIGFVFQGATLFDSMNVFENIALPINEHTSLTTDEVRKKVLGILETVGISGRENLYPHSLSGGMKRLIAIGRALALDPKYFFYDEPTTGLDPIMSERVINLMMYLKKERAISGIVVTYDFEVAKAVGDEIYMLRTGKIKKVTSISKELYE
jgi:phospholipid/cholesterol/gamma-HCH transport system ATP-binding protein